MPAAGNYNVYAHWVAGADRATNATYTITHSGGTSTVSVNQQVNGGEWVPLGSYAFAQNQAHGVVLTDQANGLVVADAIKYENANLPFYTYYVHPDHLNTPRVVTDSANQVRWRWDTADPFGMLGPTDVFAGVTFKVNDRFPGQYAHPYSSTGFVSNYHRDYAGDLGRYIQSDPIGLEGGINTYAYVGGNPISFTDPLGLERGTLTQRGYPSGSQTPQAKYQACMDEELPKCPYGTVASCATICAITAPSGPGALGCAVGCACTVGYSCYELTKMYCKGKAGL